MREILRRGGGSGIGVVRGAALESVPVGRNMIRNWRSWRLRFSVFGAAEVDAIVDVEIAGGE